MKVIYIHTHDTGRYIEPYGHNIPTPNLMKMAKNGTVFRNAYCAAPTCTPSRTAMMTGMAPHSCGIFGLTNLGFHMEGYDRHLVRFLNDNGYETVLSGVQHEYHNKEVIEYTRIIHDLHAKDKNLFNTDWEELDTKSAQIAADYIKSEKDRDYFLSVGFIYTHRAFAPYEKKVDPDYVKPPFTMPDTSETRKDMAGYISSAMIVDDCVGIVLDAVFEAGIEDEAVIFFTTDHGIAFPGMKCHLYDQGAGVSLIMMCPGNMKRGQAVDSLISHLDIFPTLCDYTQQKKPKWLQGRSIKPILDGEAAEINSEIFIENNYHAAYEPVRAIRTNRYKLIKNFGENFKRIPSNTDDGISKEFIAKLGYFEHDKEEEMLFDLLLDPCERVNLVKDIYYREVYNDLSLRLHEWMERTSDPLLQGRIPPQKTSKVCKQSSYSINLNEFEDVLE